MRAAFAHLAWETTVDGWSFDLCERVTLRSTPGVPGGVASCEASR